MLRLSKMAAVMAVAAATAAVGAHAQTAAQSEAQAVVLNADAALQRFSADPQYAARVAQALRIGSAVLVVPDYVRGGIGIGGAAGTGVLVQKENAGWGVPRFFNVRAANIGLQLGYQKGDLLLVVANTKTLNAILSGEFTLSADAAVQAGDKGQGTQASTTTSFSDTGVAAFLRGEGAYAGATIGGAKISSDDALNGAQLAPPAFERLRATLTQMAGPAPAR